MRPIIPKAEGEVRPAPLSEILDMVDRKSAGIQDTLTSECLGHLTLAISTLCHQVSMLHDQQTSDREQLEDLRSRFNKEAEVGTDDIDPLTCDPVNGHLAGGMTDEEIITHERLHAGFQQERMQKLQNENTELQSENIELERQLLIKNREITQLNNRLEQIQRVTKGW